jgi:hypothetical protein
MVTRVRIGQKFIYCRNCRHRHRVIWTMESHSFRWLEAKFKHNGLYIMLQIVK